MRFLVMLVSAGAALTLIVASGLMNWVFMISLGKSAFEQRILGAVSIAVSVLLALLPTLLLWACRERRLLTLLLGVPLFLAFGAFSLASAIGFAAKNRGSLSEDRRLATAQLAAVQQEIEKAEAKRTALGASRPFAVLQDSLRGIEQRPGSGIGRHLEDQGAGREAAGAVIEGAVLKNVPRGKSRRAPLKQIATVPRRVPRVSRS